MRVLAAFESPRGSSTVAAAAHPLFQARPSVTPRAPQREIVNGNPRPATSRFPPAFGHRDLVRLLPSVLGWTRSETGFCRRANDTHLAAVRLLSRSLGKQGSRFRSELSAMGSETRRRIELAPEVFRLLSSATPASRQRVCDALERFCAVERKDR